MEALAYGFAGIDESDLGALFTSDLKPIHGAPHLYEQRPPRHVRRDAMEHAVFKLRDSTQLDASFRFLFIKFGVSQKSERDYQVFRAMQVKEVVRLDETAPMRQPPDNAVFYLAEVHRGASYDLLVEGDHAAMGSQLEALFAKGGGSAKHVRESSAYRLKAVGLGLRDITGTGIFAMTPDEISQRYQTGDAVPVQLVFRTVPGRRYAPKELPVPQPVIDEAMFSVDESAIRTWNVPRGRYRIEATSRPNGLALAWAGDVTCDQQLKPNLQYQGVKMNCTVREESRLTLTNPSALNFGPSETMSLFVAKHP